MQIILRISIQVVNKSEVGLWNFELRDVYYAPTWVMKFEGNCKDGESFLAIYLKRESGKTEIFKKIF